MSISREIVLEALSLVHRGLKSSEALNQVFQEAKNLSPKDRAFCTELVYGILRWQGKLDATIERFSRKPLKKLSLFILDVLRLGTYQLFFLKNMTSYAAIYETVNLVKKGPEFHARGFVNGILRTMDRKRSLIIDKWYAAPKSTPEGIAFDTAHPTWMVQRWLNQFGKSKTLKICNANNEQAPLTLRVNCLKTNRSDYEAKLKKEFPNLKVTHTQTAPQGLRVEGGVSVQSLPGFLEGEFTIQDEASQRVGLVVDPKPNELILDACAAPGGKLTHFAELSQNQAKILALEIDPQKTKQTQVNLQRVDAKNIELQTIDVLRFHTENQFDKILLDAPCSALGSLRRRPEAKWTKSQALIESLSGLQLKMLNHLSPFLKPKGILVYSVCTFTPEETQGVVAAFLKNNPEFLQEEELKTVPGDSPMDGFYISRFKKKN